MSSDQISQAPSGRRRGGFALTLFEVAIGAIAAIDLVILTMVTVVDVVGRYLFNAPLRGADELAVFALAVSVFAGLPLAIARGGLIRVEVLVLRLPEGARRWTRVGTDLISGLFLGFCGWQLVIKAGKLASYGDATMFLRIPTAPFAWGMAVACFFSAAVFLLLALVALKGWRPFARDAGPRP